MNCTSSLRLAAIMLTAVGLVYGLAAFTPARVLNGRSGTPTAHAHWVVSALAAAWSTRAATCRLSVKSEPRAASVRRPQPYLTHKSPLLDSPVASCAIAAAILVRSEGPAMMQNVDSLPMNVPMQLR